MSLMKKSTAIFGEEDILQVYEFDRKAVIKVRVKERVKELKSSSFLVSLSRLDTLLISSPSGWSILSYPRVSPIL